MAEIAFQAWPSSDRCDRQRARMWALIDVEGVTSDAVVCDLSATGFGVETSRAIALGGTVAVTLGAAAPFRAVVVHGADGRYGCRLETPLGVDELDALTRNGPFAAMPPVALRDDEEAADPRLPLLARAAVILGGSVACWAAILLSAHALLA